MKERPIVFTSDMVRAILDERKVQTRRIAAFPSWVTGVEKVGEWWHGNGYHPKGECEHSKCAHIGGQCADSTTVGPSIFTLRCPYGVPADRLWVREGVITHVSIPQLFGYVADGCRATEPWLKQRTARYMPKWASRITLEITDVRVDRVQSTSDLDAISEGVFNLDDIWLHREFPEYAALHQGWIKRNNPREAPPIGPGPRSRFQHLWDSINAKRGYGWNKNPWVFVLTFRRVQ